ncbi:hypothetical protein FB645_006023 [Coemansia sp. IMI 203386]|nr:hypothetical protein FB645_006023 [Coemansia sp. IMI 203386]
MTIYSDAVAAAPSQHLPMVKGDLLDHARMIVVVDTNCFLNNLSLVRSLSSQALGHGLVIVVPKVVVQELDGLKLSYRTNTVAGQGPKDVASMARAATRFLEESLGYEGNALRCQKRSEYLEKEIINDDQIIDCCLYFIEKHKLPVAVLSQDRLLNVKARANGCATCGEWTKDAASLIFAIEHALLGTNKANSSIQSYVGGVVSMPTVSSKDNGMQMTAVVAGRTRVIARSKLHRPPELHKPTNSKGESENKGNSANKGSLYPGEVIDVSDDDDKDGLPAQRAKKALTGPGLADNIPKPSISGCSSSSTTMAKARRKQREVRRRSFLNSHSTSQSPLLLSYPNTYLPTSNQASKELAFGHFNADFTFSVPSYLNQAHIDSGYSAPKGHASAQHTHAQSPIVINDSDDDMEVDSGFQEPQAGGHSSPSNVGTTASLEGSERTAQEASTNNLLPVGATLANTSTHLKINNCTGSSSRTASKRAASHAGEKQNIPAPTSPSPQTDANANSDKPVVIYLDDLPRKASSDAPMSAFDVSCEIVVFIRDSVKCGLTKVLCDQLKKRLPLSYAEDWTDVLKRRFEPPPWNSATTILTVIFCYWNLINQAFHRRDRENIQRALPWVMKLEGVALCPQTTAPLPPNLQFEQLALALSNKSPHCMQRQKEETVQLIALSNNLLAQCALVESEAQEKIRHFYYNRWSKWLKTNTP